jgi:hypothetical protein
MERYGSAPVLLSGGAFSTQSRIFPSARLDRVWSSRLAESSLQRGDMRRAVDRERSEAGDELHLKSTRTERNALKHHPRSGEFQPAPEKVQRLSLLPLTRPARPFYE